MRAPSVHADRSNAGFTLPEVMLAMAILLFIVAALTQAVVTGQVHAYEAIRGVRATSLAEAMVDEVLARAYHDPDGAAGFGPDAGESDRADFDNVDDYHGHEEAPGAVTDFAGVAYPAAYQGFSRRVDVEAATVNVLGADRDGVRVTVTVTDDRGHAWTVSRFIPEPAEGT